MTNLPASTKKLILLLAGLGALGGGLLIGLGLVLFFSQTTPTPVAVKPTPTQIQAATLAPTPTILADIVIVASATPVAPKMTPRTQATDSLSKPPTATRVPTGTPTPTATPQRRQGAAVDGSLELIGPPDDSHIPTDEIEFKWKWRENKGCEQPPDGYAFEIRIWRNNDSASPMGAMDAQAQKQNITCDPGSGIRTFTIGRVKSVPGVEGLKSGRFRWDVTLVQLNPYNPVITTQYRTFFY